MSDGPASHGELRGGELLTAVSNAMVGLLRQHYGRGPMKAKSYVVDDILMCVMRDGLTAADETLIASGRADPADPAADARFLRIREIGPWTLQCLRLFGRGEPDALPAGDLAYVKLVGVIAGLGRRATVAEVEEFYARYEPYRGLAGVFSLSHYGWTQSRARGLPLAPDCYADAA